MELSTVHSCEVSGVRDIMELIAVTALLLRGMRVIMELNSVYSSDVIRQRVII